MKIIGIEVNKISGYILPSNIVSCSLAEKMGVKKSAIP